MARITVSCSAGSSTATWSGATSLREVAYRWDIDGTIYNKTTPTLKKTYALDGQHTAILWVRNSAGKWSDPTFKNVTTPCS